MNGLPERAENEAWQRNFSAALNLIGGKGGNEEGGDESKIVGLLVIVKLLPTGPPESIARVMQALGSKFIDRMLLPLKPGHAKKVGTRCWSHADSSQTPPDRAWILTGRPLDRAPGDRGGPPAASPYLIPRPNPPQLCMHEASQLFRLYRNGRPNPLPPTRG